MNSIRTRILKERTLARMVRLASSFNEFDPNEDTESRAVVLHSGQRLSFNEFDPNEDTESATWTSRHSERETFQ